jgi:hypothetical protein
MKRGKVPQNLILLDWDLLLKKIEEINIPQEKAEEIKKNYLHQQAVNCRIKF